MVPVSFRKETKMSKLSAGAVKRLQIATADKDAGNELANSINKGENVSAQTSHTLAALIVATNVSQTIDFGALKVGDKVLKVKVADGTAAWLTIATAGTLGEAAVVGDTYMVLRAKTDPAAETGCF